MCAGVRVPSVAGMTHQLPAPSGSTTPTTHTPRTTRRLGLPLAAIIGLALLAVPRVVLHDLGLITEGTLVNALLVFVPPVVWVAVAVLRRVPRAFVTLVVVGLMYGVFLALGHQLLWDVSFGESPPQLGGNLSDLDPAAQNVILRAFAAGSSLVTGTVVGAVAGAIAAGLQRLRRPTVRA